MTCAGEAMSAAAVGAIRAQVEAWEIEAELDRATASGQRASWASGASHAFGLVRELFENPPAADPVSGVRAKGTTR